MSNKRRDNKGRILRNGESQTKDGKYRFTYYENGKQKCLYSWKLEHYDTIPKGKRDCISLREQELALKNPKNPGLPAEVAGLTVYELANRYVKQRKNVRANTRSGYKTVLNFLSHDPFGAMSVGEVKTSDAKLWLVSLQEVQKKKYSTIHTIRGVLRPAFRMAVEDDLLPKNPFDFELGSVIVNDSVTREAISKEDEIRMMEFIKNDNHFCKYYDAIYILFNTGMRISEFCGLTLDKVDLKGKTISVDHQLVRSSDMEYIIQSPKTECGERKLPIRDDVVECFKNIIENRPTPAEEPVIDGVKGFLYLDKNDMPMVALHWEKYFQHIIQKHNYYNDENPLPKVTPHVCRHTYCSNMAKTGLNPKTLQYLMGHADISVTLNTYTHIKFEDAREELVRSNLL